MPIVLPCFPLSEITVLIVVIYSKETDRVDEITGSRGPGLAAHRPRRLSRRGTKRQRPPVWAYVPDKQSPLHRGYPERNQSMRRISGGGAIVLPPGKWLSGTLFLKNNVTLYLAAGSTLLGSGPRCEGLQRDQRQDPLLHRHLCGTKPHCG